MFKAIDAIDGREVISLDTEPMEIRSIERTHGLVCQECRHGVFLRSGDQRRPHFAHYRLEDCPVRSESPELLRARALLYGWLRDQCAARHDPAQVTLEKRLETDSGFPRPVDCYVQTKEGRKIGFWILESGMRPERRDELINTFTDTGILVHWILLTPPKRVEESSCHGESDLLLNTTERELMYARPHCPMSVIESGVASNFLQYLNTADNTLETWRRLRCVHLPQQYKGEFFQSSLTELDLLAPTGHILHPGEREAARARLQAIREVASRPTMPKVPSNQLRTEMAYTRPQNPPNELATKPDDGPSLITARLICRGCGQEQKPGAWTQAELGAGTCLCYPCSKRR